MKSKILTRDKIKDVVLSSQGLPLALTFIIISILFVLFRMKGVEIDYKSNSLSKDVEKSLLENKELKAKKARMLSTKRLRKMADKHNLKQPTQKQVIVVP